MRRPVLEDHRTPLDRRPDREGKGPPTRPIAPAFCRSLSASWN